jgi:serine/threonine-protein kinase
MSKQTHLTVFDLIPGKLVADRYEIVRSHRQGGLSAAFEVIDQSTDERCELQLFPASLFEGDAQAQDFTSAWEPWKRVRSEAVVAVREVMALGDSTLLLITDFPSGESLRSVLNARKRLTPDEIVDLGLQLCDGLGEIHAHGLVHGDIKPYTIEILGRGSEMRARLLDGGITPGLWTAKHLGEKTALIGTPFYAPIEQFGGDSPDVQSDIYNAAAVLFECLAGVLPWRGVSFLEVFQAKLDKSTPSLRAFAPDLAVDPALEAAIVTGCLAEKRKRYATAHEFRARLAALNGAG